MPINSNRKGKRAERDWAKFLRDHGYASARRGQQFAGGKDSPDVICADLPDYHFEVKHVEKLNVYQAMSQAVKDGVGKVPVVAHKRNRSGWLVTMSAENFANLLKQVTDAKT